MFMEPVHFFIYKSNLIDLLLTFCYTMRYQRGKLNYENK